MVEYIEREALLKAYLDLVLAKSKAAKARKGAAFFQSDLLPEAELTDKEWVRLINAAPAADVEPVKHGEWLARARKNGVGKCCSACMAACTFAPMPYCPNCGAKMKG